MKLTNTIRDAFIRSVMKDVPTVDYKEQAREIMVADALTRAPKEVQKMWSDVKTRGWVATTLMYSDDSYTFSATVPGCNRHQHERPSIEAMPRLKELRRLHIAQEEKLQALRQSLNSAAYSVTTRKALAELMPEFEKYLPADNAKATKVMLPAVANVVADFVKAGWPKSEKKDEVSA